MTASPSTNLSRLTKWAFGAGDLGPAIVAGIQGFFLFSFLLNVAGLQPAAAGTVLLVVKIWDAVNDPLIGTLSDRTVSRWGRRRSWMLFGAIPFGLAYFMLWLVPPIGDAGKFWYYLVAALMLDTAFTAVNVPYTALTAELTGDYDERTSLTSYRFGFSLLGSMFAAAAHGQILAAFPENEYLGYALSAALFAVIISAPFFFTVAFTREPERAARPAPEGPGFWEGLRIAFRNRAFVLVTVIYLLAWLCIQFVQNNLLLYVTYWVQAGDYFVPLVLAVQISAFVFLVVWARVSQRIGKQKVYFLGMTFWVLVQVALYFVQPGQVSLLFVLAVLAGVGVSIGYLVPWSMLPDVIELDELETGQRREGVFYGFFVFLQKLGISLGLWASGQVLQLTGYIRDVPGQPMPVQPDAVLQALRLLVGPVPAVILLVSFVAVYLYPITRERHAQIRERLTARALAAGD